MSFTMNYDIRFEDLEPNSNIDTYSHEVTARSKTKDGREIVIDFNMYNISEEARAKGFLKDKPHWIMDQHTVVDGMQEEVTNRGDAFKILATVMKSIDFIYNTYNIVCYQTSYSGESKIKMFDRMCERFTKKYNFYMERDCEDDMVYINAIDLQQAKYLLKDYQQLSKIYE